MTGTFLPPNHHKEDKKNGSIMLWLFDTWCFFESEVRGKTLNGRQVTNTQDGYLYFIERCSIYT